MQRFNINGGGILTHLCLNRKMFTPSPVPDCGSPWGLCAQDPGLDGLWDARLLSMSFLRALIFSYCFQEPTWQAVTSWLKSPLPLTETHEYEEQPGHLAPHVPREEGLHQRFVLSLAFRTILRAPAARADYKTEWPLGRSLVGIYRVQAQ